MLEILKKYPSTHFLLNFTETDFTNQMLQTIYETEVRHAIEHGKHVIFQATPIFRNNETIARGINLQALSTDGTLNFNVYLFNVEPGIRINYQDGPIKATGKYSRPIADRPRQYYRSY